jgi:hypothetical protein
MHNGSMATLHQVFRKIRACAWPVSCGQFYNRGGNFRNPEHDAEIAPIGMPAQERADLVA